jgi:hypothetical protein
LRSACSTVAASAARHVPTCSRRSAGLVTAMSVPPRRARHQWHRAPVADVRGVDLLGERAQLRVVGEVDAHGVVSVSSADASPGCGRWRAAAECADARDFGETIDGFDRIAHQVVDRHRLVGDAVDEAGVGAVLQQAPHQVRQQVLVRTHRRVHAAGHVEAVGRHDFGVQVVAHAVQFLELERARAPCARCDGSPRSCARCAWRTSDRSRPPLRACGARWRGSSRRCSACA